MKWIGLILSVLLLLTLCIIFIKVKIRIYKRGTGKGEIDIYLTLIKHIHIDIGKQIKKYIERYSIRENVNKIKTIHEISSKNKIIIDKIFKCCTVKKIIFVPGYNTTSPIFYPYVTILNWQLVSMVKYLLNKFKRIDYEYYNVMMNDDNKKGFNLDFLLEIPIRSIIHVLISNMKDTIKLIKSIKGGNVNGRKQTIN